MNRVSIAGKPNLLYRLGVVGFWFFLIKGLLWLAAPFVFLYFL